MILLIFIHSLIRLTILQKKELIKFLWELITILLVINHYPIIISRTDLLNSILSQKRKEYVTLQEIIILLPTCIMNMIKRKRNNNGNNCKGKKNRSIGILITIIMWMECIMMSTKKKNINNNYKKKWKNMANPKNINYLLHIFKDYL